MLAARRTIEPNRLTTTRVGELRKNDSFRPRNRKATRIADNTEAIVPRIQCCSEAHTRITLDTRYTREGNIIAPAQPSSRFPRRLTFSRSSAMTVLRRTSNDGAQRPTAGLERSESPRISPLERLVRRRGSQRYLYCNSLRRPSCGSLSIRCPLASSGQSAPGHEAVLPRHPPTQHTTR